MRDLVPESPQHQAAAASISAVFGGWLIYTFLRTPQYTRIPDPRIVPINGLLWLALGISALIISVYFVHTLNRQSEAANADTVGSEGHSRSTSIENLHQRYAAGDISHAEFERQLERLLETEDISQVDQPMSLLKNNDNEPHIDTDSAFSSELTEEQG
jgi:hypothetical protein